MWSGCRMWSGCSSSTVCPMCGAVGDGLYSVGLGCGCMVVDLAI